MAEVFRRQLVSATSEHGGPHLLDAVSWTEARDGTEHEEIRAFFANPAAAEQIAPEAASVEIVERRDVSGCVLVYARAAGREVSLDLFDAIPTAEAPTPGKRPCTFTPARSDQDRFAGLNCLFGQRLEEPAETVLDWLQWHHD